MFGVMQRPGGEASPGAPPLTNPSVSPNTNRTVRCTPPEALRRRASGEEEAGPQPGGKGPFGRGGSLAELHSLWTTGYTREP